MSGLPDTPFLPKHAAVANKAASNIQITAEQLLRDATDRGSTRAAPQRRLVDAEELDGFRTRKRQEFEDKLRMQRHHMGTWIAYATWEAGQKDLERARSVFERSLQIEYQNTGLWQKYIEMEKQNQNVMRCRNLLERVTKILPRQERFWLEYVTLEESLKDYAGARAIYTKWLTWKPEPKAYITFCSFEERCNERDRARDILKQLVRDHPSKDHAERFIQFEIKNGYRKEHLVRPTDIKLADVDHDVLLKRRSFYEEELASNSLNYDLWFDYIRLERNEGGDNIDTVVDLFERAVVNIPPIDKKQFWSRYIYLWLNYAVYLELRMGDEEKCEKIITKMVDSIPHKKFTFVEVWKYAADYYIRLGNITKARQIYGMAIGMAGKHEKNIFGVYANLELELGNLERAREIYAKFVQYHSDDAVSWICMIDLEVYANNIQRARGLCEMAVELDELNVPEVIWKRYIDMERQLYNYGEVRSLYERLIDLSEHYLVYVAYSQFEYKDVSNINSARDILEKGIENMRIKQDDKGRSFLLKQLLKLEREIGETELIEKTWIRQPKITVTDTQEERYVFPDDQIVNTKNAGMSLLNKAKAWKNQKV